MNFEVSPYFLITNNAEKLRIRLEEIFNANTVYIQRVKDRPLELYSHCGISLTCLRRSGESIHHFT